MGYQSEQQIIPNNTQNYSTEQVFFKRDNIQNIQHIQNIQNINNINNIQHAMPYLKQNNHPSIKDLTDNLLNGHCHKRKSQTTIPKKIKPQLSTLFNTLFQCTDKQSILNLMTCIRKYEIFETLSSFDLSKLNMLIQRIKKDHS